MTAVRLTPSRHRRRALAGRTVLGLLGLAVLFVLTMVLSLMAGSTFSATVLEVLRGGGSSEARYVVAELRVPRTVAGLIVGAALGVAGALVQAFTRNPLADPGILGVNAGAAFAVAIGVAFLGMRDRLLSGWLCWERSS